SGNVTNFAAFDQIESGMFLCHTDPGGVVTKVAAFHFGLQRAAGRMADGEHEDRFPNEVTTV
ncbi:MAG: hypothetical protein WD278_02655, partial [Pirellulales bacterium]